ncbi:MAG: Lrp/AsnC family transcriptional regulator [Desulfomonilaceae bacterium]
MKQESQPSIPSIDELDKKILVILQGDLGDTPEPYAAIAEALETSESQVIQRISRMLREGVIRRLGAMIRHIEAGIGFNGMVVWKAPPEDIERIGKLLASFPEVTHCYERPGFGSLGGTLFTMVHAESETACREIVERMAAASGLDEYEVLFSSRELKKISMTYFDENASREDPCALKGS